MSAWRIALVSLVMLASAPPDHAAADVSASGVGESIYLRGVLASGAPLEGIREAGGVPTRGAEAACVNCHQRSGLGSREGNISIPPITGEYLFHSRGHSGNEPVLPYVESMHGNRDPYSDATLVRAIREGIDSEGRPLSYLMPRFALNDADMAALIVYLKELAVRRVPGVTDTTLHFATIFTPDADPVKRSGVLDVLEHYFVEKNSFPIGPSPRMSTSGRTEYSKSMYMANRRWQLHVWDLTGPALTWRAQLDKHLAEDPVYAVLSGLGGADWAPVHEFCEQNKVPCLFPNVEVPVDSERGFYSLYFSRGVLLEAQLIRNEILNSRGRGPAHVVRQIYRAGDSGEAAAQALTAELMDQDVTVRNHALAAGAQGRGLSEALRGVGTGEILVLWLRSADIAALGSAPPAAAAVYMSGLMGGLENSPLPSSWREGTFLAYPFDIPDKRGVRLDYPLGWFSFRHIPVVAQQAQADTYLACTLLAEVLNHHMADNFARPYLIEQLQSGLEHRIMTGYYPRLTLGSHQRFASKGGYIARFSDPHGPHLRADGDWTVP
jgi:hypothetical protein